MTDPQNPDVPVPPPSYNQAPPPSYNQAPPPSYNQAPPPSYNQAQPAYASAPPAPPGTPADQPIPGKTLGIVALVVAIFFNVIGLILGIVALSQSRKAGHKNGPAVAAIIIGAILTVIGIIVAIFAVIALTAAAGFANEAFQACQAVDFTGTVTVNGVEVSCSTLDR